MIGMTEFLRRPPGLKSRTCDSCGKYFTPQNYAQQVCGATKCFLDWVNKQRRKDPLFATRPRIPLGGE